MIPKTPKSTLQLAPDKIRELATAIAERFDPSKSSGEDVALAANVSLALVSAASEVERLQEVESQVSMLKENALKYLYTAAKIGDALSTCVLRDEAREKTRNRIAGPIRTLLDSLDEAVRRAASDDEEPKPTPAAQPPQPQPAA